MEEVDILLSAICNTLENEKDNGGCTYILDISLEEED